jgi:hypothetical protein
MQAALPEIAFTASRRLLPSAMKDFREASSPPPMKAPLESADTAFLENASSMVVGVLLGECESASG